MKRCPGCHEVKPPAEFYRSASSKDGLQSNCKACQLAASRKRRAADPEKARAATRKWRDANPEKVRAADHKRHVENPEKERARYRRYRDANPEKIRVAARARYAENPEKDRARGRARYAENPEKDRARCRRWRVANPEACALREHRRRARKKANGVFLVTVKEACRMLSKPCYLCGVAPSTDLEHIVPIERGGATSVGNLLGACRSCNSSKGTKLLVEYRRYVRMALV